MQRTGHTGLGSSFNVGNDNQAAIKPKGQPLGSAFTIDPNNISDLNASPKYQDQRSRTMVDVSKYEKYMPYGVYDMEGLDKLRAKEQSGWAQLGGFLNQALVGEVLGGTIGSLGAAVESTVGELTDYLWGEETKFDNAMMRIGKNVQDWTQESTPIYQQDPGKSFQFGDSGYIFQNLVSLASSASMLIGGKGVISGLGYLGKLAKVTDKVGDVAKYWGEVGVTTAFMRNAESMRSSMDVSKNVRDHTWDAVNKLSDEEFNKVLQAQDEIPKNVTRVEYAEALGNKSGWLNYKLNSINFVFDLIQVGGIFKAIGGRTRTGVAGSTKVGKAQSELLGNATHHGSTWYGRLGTMAGAGFSEAPEEMINHAAQEAAERYGKKHGKQSDNMVSEFLSDAVSERGLESGLFGYFGGKVFNAVGGIMNKANTTATINTKINEIESRTKTAKASLANFQKIKEDLDNGVITAQTAAVSIQAEARKVGFELGANAAKAGNVDLLLETLEAKDFREKVIGNAVDSQSIPGVDKLVFEGLKAGALKAEQAYSKVYGKLFYKTASPESKQAITNAILKSSQNADYLRTIADTGASEAAQVIASLDPDIQADANLFIEAESTKQALIALRDNKDLTKFTSNPGRVLKALEALEAQDKAVTNLPEVELTEDIARAISAKAEAKVATAFANEMDNIANELTSDTKIKEAEKAVSDYKASKVKERLTELEGQVDALIAAGKTEKEITDSILVKDKKEAKFVKDKLKAVRTEREPLLSRMTNKANRLKKKLFPDSVIPVADEEALAVSDPSELIMDEEIATATDPEETNLEWDIAVDPNRTFEPEPSPVVEWEVNSKVPEETIAATETTKVVEGVVLSQEASEATPVNDEVPAKKRRGRPKKVVQEVVVVPEPAAEQAAEEAQDNLDAESIVVEIQPITPEVPIGVQAEPNKIEEAIVEDTTIVTTVPTVEQIVDVEQPEVFADQAETTTDEPNSSETHSTVYLPSVATPEVVSENDLTITVNAKTANEVKALNKIRASILAGKPVTLNLGKVAVDQRFATDDPNETAIGVFDSNGVQIGFINRLSSIQAEINRLDKDGNKTAADERRINLIETTRIRQAFAKDPKTKVEMTKLSVGSIRNTTNQKLNKIRELAAKMKVLVYRSDKRGGHVTTATLKPLVGKGKAFDSKFVRNLYNDDMLYNATNLFLLVPQNPSDKVNPSSKESVNNMIPLFIESNPISFQDAELVMKQMNILIQGLKDGSSPFRDESMIEAKKAIHRIIPTRDNIIVGKKGKEEDEDSWYAPTFVVHGVSKNNKGRIEFLTENNTVLVSIYVNKDNSLRLTKSVWKGQKTFYKNLKEYKAQIGDKIPINGKDTLDLTPESKQLFFDTVVDGLQTKKYNLFLEEGKEQDLLDLILNSDRYGLDVKTVEDESGELLSLFGAKRKTENGSDNVVAHIKLVSGFKANPVPEGIGVEEIGELELVEKPEEGKESGVVEPVLVSTIEEQRTEIEQRRTQDIAAIEERYDDGWEYRSKDFDGWDWDKQAVVSKINAKYDAELAALEPTTLEVTTTPEVIQEEVDFFASSASVESLQKEIELLELEKTNKLKKLKNGKRVSGGVPEDKYNSLVAKTTNEYDSVIAEKKAEIEKLRLEGKVIPPVKKPEPTSEELKQTEKRIKVLETKVKELMEALIDKNITFKSVTARDANGDLPTKKLRRPVKDQITLINKYGIELVEAGIELFQLRGSEVNPEKFATDLILQRPHIGGIKLSEDVGAGMPTLLKLINDKLNSTPKEVIVEKEEKLDENQYGQPDLTQQEEDDLADLMMGGLTFRASANETTDEVIESNQQQVENFQRLLGEQVPIEILPYQLMDGTDTVYGVFKTAMTKLSKYSVVGTEYHEAFHAILNLYHTPEQQQEIFNEARAKFKLDNHTDLQVEEFLAEKFRSFMLKQKVGTVDTTVTGKIREFFQKLYEALLNYINKQDAIDSLFAKSAKGGFRNASRVNNTEVTRYSTQQEGQPLIDRFKDNYTPEEQTVYIKYASLLVMRVLPMFDGATPEALKSGLIPNIRQGVKAAIGKHARSLPDQSDAKLTSNHLYGLLTTDDNSFWSSVTDYVRNTLKVNISGDESIDTSALSLKQMEKLWDDTQQNGVSQKASMDGELKRFLMCTEKVKSFGYSKEDGKVIFNYEPVRDNVAQVPEVENFNLLYSALSTQLADSIDTAEMMAKVLELGKLNPSFLLVYEKLKSDPVYQEKLFTCFNKPKLDSIQVKHGVDRPTKITTPTVSYRLANSFTDSVKTVVESFNNPNSKSLITNQKIAKFRERNVRVRDNFEDNQKVLAKDKEDLLGMLRSLGITVSRKHLDMALNTMGNREKFVGDRVVPVSEVEVAESLREAINKVGEELFNQSMLLEIKFDEYGRVGEIAAFFEDVFLDTKEPSFYNANRSLEYALQKPLFVNKFFSKLQQVFNRKTVNKVQAYRTVTEQMRDVTADPAMKYSNWFNSIADLATMSLKDAAKEFKFFWVNGLIDLDSFVGRSYSETSDYDWYSAKLALFMKDKKFGHYPLPVPSDSGRIGVIRAPIYYGKFKEGVMGEDSQMRTALLNILQYDLVKANAARELLFGQPLTEEVKDNLLEGYHFKGVDEDNNPILVDDNGVPTGRVFDTSSITFEEDGQVRSIAKIIGVDKNDNLVYKGQEGKLAYPVSIFHNGVFDMSTLTPNKQRLLNKFLDSFVKAEYDKSSVKYLSILNDLERDFKRSGFNSKEALVANFVINSFIATQEIGVLFNGNNSEYSGVTDTTKRAKQLISPTQYLSTKHRGATSKYIVIPDIFITPNTLQANSENLAKALAKSNPKFKGMLYDHRAAFGTYGKNALEEAVFEKMSPYLSVNSTDGQGFITLEYFKLYAKDRGIVGKNFDNLIKALESGKDYNHKYLQEVLQILKPYYINRKVNPVTGVMETVQIKTSVQVLIPGLVKGTVLEAVLNKAPSDLAHIYTKSAVKVGNKRLSQVNLANAMDGSLSLANLNIQELDNSQWGVQLDVPEHLKDTTNNLSLQAKKIPFTNIPEKIKFTVGTTSFTGKELHEKVQEAFSTTSSGNVKALVDKMSNPQNVADIIRKYIEENNLPKHYLDMIELNEAKTAFKIPLSVPTFANKFQSLLIKPFLTAGLKIPVLGGHATLLSDSLITNFVNTGDIDYSAYSTEVADRIRATGKVELRQAVISDGKSKYIQSECLLPAWTKKFFKNGNRIDLNDLPEEARRLLGHRSPLEGKYSFLSLKVVGFLPEGVGSTIVLPAALVAQTGHDFDVDSEYLVFQYLDEENKPIVYDLKKPMEQWNKKEINNFLFDAYRSVIEHPSQAEEHIVPSSFRDVTAMIKKQKEIVGIVEANENPNSLATQDRLRSVNLMGRHLKGVAVTYASMMPIAQKLKLISTQSITVEYPVSSYDPTEMAKKYKSAKVVGDKIRVEHNAFGRNRTDFTDAQGELVSTGLAKTVANILDIIKEGTLVNLNLFTGGNYMILRSLGIPLDVAAMMLIQPIIVRAFKSGTTDLLYKGKVVEPKKHYMDMLYNINKLLSHPGIKFKDIPEAVLNAEQMEKSARYFANDLPETLSRANDAQLKRLKDECIYQLGILKTWDKITAINNDYRKVIKGTSLDKTKAANIPELYEPLMAYADLQNEDTLIKSAFDSERKLRTVGDVLENTEAYSSIRTYAKSITDYLAVLDKYFIDGSPSILEAALGQKTYSPELHKKMVEIATFDLLNNNIPAGQIERILKAVPNTDMKMDFGTFQGLSVANKLFVIKYYARESLNETNILYFMSPKISKEDFDLKGFYEIKFDKPQLSDGLDTLLVESFEGMLESDDPFVKDLAEDLVKYNYVTQGFGFSGNSFANYIPTSYLEGQKWFDKLRDAYLDETKVLDSGDLLSLASRNGWKDPELSNIAFIDRTRLAPDHPLLEVNEYNTFTLPYNQIKELGFSKRFYTFVVKSKDEKTYIVQTEMFKQGKEFYFVPVSRLSNGYLKTETGSRSLIDSQNPMYVVLNGFGLPVDTTETESQSRSESSENGKVIC